MAYLALIYDPDPQRRRRFVRAARKQAQQCGNLPATCCVDHGQVSGVLAAPHPALVRIHHTPRRLQVRMGTMSTHRMPPGQADEWPAGFDVHRDPYPGGWFAACTIRANGDLFLGGDRWGLYPLYYSRLPDGAVLMASAPAYMGADPAFREELDFTGLCGLLMTNGLIDNRSLFRNVSRLPAGRILSVTGPGKVSVSDAPPPPAENGWSGLQREDALRRLQTLWPEILQRLHPGQPSRIYLSGGIDSRMIAGGLARLGLPVTGVTIGARGDHERIAAKAVAQVTGMPWHAIPDDPPRKFLAGLRARVRWGSLSSGFSNGCGFPEPSFQRQAAVFGWTGVGLDDLLGGKTIGYLHHDGPADPAEHMLNRLNEWGIRPTVLRQTLRRRQHRDLPAALQDVFLRDFRRHGHPDTLSACISKLENRVRFHLGGVLWQTSFRCWPIIPGLEPEILEAGFHLAPAVLAQRGLQREFLLRFHPEMNSIPVDANTRHFLTLHQVPYRRKWFQPVLRDPRHYYRLFDPGHPAWRIVRREVEPYRHLLEDFFLPAKLIEIWPPCHQRWRCHDPFSTPAGARNLMAAAWKLSMLDRKRPFRGDGDECQQF